jgi:hypothetical protein
MWSLFWEVIEKILQKSKNNVRSSDVDSN